MSGNAALAEVVDPDRLIVNVALPGAEAPRLGLGQPAALSVATDIEKTAGTAPPASTGTVSFIGLQVDPRAATVPVRIALPAGSGLRPGQFVQARIAVEERAERLAVPVESMVTGEGESAIFVTDFDFIEVAGDGLKGGMVAVTTGA